MNTVRIFGERELSSFLDARRQEMRAVLQMESTNYLLTVNEQEYIAHLVQRFRVEPIYIQFESVSVSSTEKLVSAEKFPGDFSVYSGKEYPCQVITYHIPYRGENELLKCNPYYAHRPNLEVRFNDEEIRFDVISWRNDANEVRRDAQQALQCIERAATDVSSEVVRFNNSLMEEADRLLRERKQTLLRQLNLLASLGVPLQKAAEVAPSFSVPIAPRRIGVITDREAAKPAGSNAAFKPEPVLDESTYGELLRMMSDFGREMERHPSVYADKDEETLRDHFILLLSPQFQSVAGEVFNKRGKTDILIRHEGANIFVAECKFWRGSKVYEQTIDQLISYLTWRDSKAAIMLFVDQVSFQTVLNQIPEQTRKHDCFVRDQGCTGESVFRFEFRLKDDAHRRFWLTVLCFHFPRAITVRAGD